MIELRRRHSAESAPSSRLPNGYQEVEYLEDYGTQYIELPIYKGFKGSIIAKCEFLVIANTLFELRFVLGWGDGAQVGLVRTSDTIRKWHNYNTSDTIVEYNKIYNTKLVIDANKSELYVDDVLVISNTAFNNILPLTLYRLSTTSQYKNPLYGRIYEVLIKGSTNMHLIPCYRTSDRVAGMYDIVNDVFYTNAGTGEFLVGADVGVNTILPIEYQQVEYIQGQWKPYIDTGVVADSLTDIEIDFLYVDGQYIAGAGLGNASSRYAIATSSLELLFLIGKENKSGFYLEKNKRYRVQMNSSDSTASVYDYENNSSENFVLNNTLVSSQYPILLFLRKEGTTQYTSPMFGNIYKCIIKQNKTIVKNLIPCYRKADNVAGMYDVVNNVFHTNQGTGEFIVGADVIG